MRTVEQIQKKKVKLLYKYRKKINFANAYDVRVSSFEYDEYTREIMLVEGKIMSLSWVLDEDI